MGLRTSVADGDLVSGTVGFLDTISVDENNDDGADDGRNVDDDDDDDDGAEEEVATDADTRDVDIDFEAIDDAEGRNVVDIFLTGVGGS
jgi:hypothetical protein